LIEKTLTGQIVGKQEQTRKPGVFEEQKDLACEDVNWFRDKWNPGNQVALVCSYM